MIQFGFMLSLTLTNTSLDYNNFVRELKGSDNITKINS